MTHLATRLACAAALLALAACGPKSPSAGKPTEQAQSMARMRADVDMVSAYLSGTVGRAEALTAAQDLVGWSARMRELFPPAQVTTLYLDITPAMAEAAPETMRRTAEQLAAAVASGDLARTRQALATTEIEGCGACHRHGYR